MVQAPGSPLGGRADLRLAGLVPPVEQGLQGSTEDDRGDEPVGNELRAHEETGFLDALSIRRDSDREITCFLNPRK